MVDKRDRAVPGQAGIQGNPGSVDERQICGVTNTAGPEGDTLESHQARLARTDVEAQERRGQQELCHAWPVVLPTLLSHRSPPLSVLYEAGVILGGSSFDDPLFMSVELPHGWRVRPAEDHSMWSDLIDGDGAVWAKIFYKAAFYDRRAEMTIVGPEYRV